jgi:hypothetical protein
MDNKIFNNNSNADGCFFSALIVIGHVVSWIGSGVLAWNWIDPDSFGRAVLFIIVWGIIGGITDFILGIIIAGIAKLFD